MPPKINLKCLECAKVHRDVFVYNRPECYDFKNCRRKRSYYRNLEDNRLKEHKYHRYLKFKDDKCFVCCTVMNLETHHVESQNSGGKDTRKNVVTLCKPCHSVITRFERKLGCESKVKPRWIVAEEKFGIRTE
jgi:5-methylcytosine-specific restriction endonuclease McrA